MALDARWLEDLGLRTVVALGVAAVTWLVARGIRRATIAGLARRHARANAVVLLGNAARWFVLLFGVLSIIGIYSGEAFVWVVGSLGVFGFVAGLSVQDVLKSVIAGIWVLVEQPIRIGDEIEVGGYTGTVELVAFRVTRLRRSDGREVIVPNSTLMTTTIVNLSRGQ